MGAIPENLQSILRTLSDFGHKGWCVGGCVRDTLLGRMPGDWDVATSARPKEVLDIFAPRAIPTGLRHGTVTVVTDQGRVEVTTLRRDGSYGDHRHPDQVSFTDSLEEDLSRRDFTVNAMAMGLDGVVIDPFGGQTDLHRGVLRCVGEPVLRLQEDALRIMRALRFASVLSFAIDGETAAAVHREKESLQQIAAERIAVELGKLLCGESAAEVLLTYPDVLGVVLPEILPAVGFDQRNSHHCYDVWEHTVRAVSAAPQNLLLRYALLFHDLGKPETFSMDEQGVGHFYGHGKRSAELAEAACRRLRLDNDSRETIVLLVRLHDAEILATEKSIRRMLRRIGEERLRLLLQMKRCDNLAQHPDYHGRQRTIDQLEVLLDMVLRQELCFSLKQLAVKGNDLTDMGLSGPAVGRALNTLLDLVVEERLPNDRSTLLAYVKEELL